MKYNVSTIRASGIECKWTRTRNNAPIIVGRVEGIGGGKWYAICDRTWKSAEKVGILQAFKEHNALGNFFSVAL